MTYHVHRHVPGFSAVLLIDIKPGWVAEVHMGRTLVFADRAFKTRTTAKAGKRTRLNAEAIVNLPGHKAWAHTSRNLSDAEAMQAMHACEGFNL